MDSVEQVMKGLTKARRDLLLELPASAVESYAPRVWLIDNGLAIVVRPPDGKLHATALGQQVISRLLSSGGEG